MQSSFLPYMKQEFSSSHWPLQQLGKEAAVPLTNSLSLADRLRMLHLIKQNHDKEFPEACPFRFGKSDMC